MVENAMAVFDVWGPVVNASAGGPESLRLFKSIAPRKGLSAEEIDRRVFDYNELCRGNPEYIRNGERKMAVIRAVDSVVNPSFEDGSIAEFNPDFSNAVYEDGARALDSIMNMGVGAMFFTSGNTPWLAGALDAKVSGLSARMHPRYIANKTQADAHKILAEKLHAQGYDPRVFTDDEPAPIEAAFNSHEYRRLVFVDRAGKFPIEAARFRDLGVQVVDNLDKLNYRELVLF